MDRNRDLTEEQHERLCLVQENIRVDRIFLREHAQRAFIAELLRRYRPATQDKFLTAY